jgi:REP element-mobilizing transposase RayT
MANTYTQIYIHVVFTVKGKQNLIKKQYREKLHKYITGIVSNRNQKLMTIFAMPDHVHILIGLSPEIALSDLVRDIKAGSSKYISENRWVTGKFSWQKGFGAFSYSKSQVDRVVKYILNQEEHHRKKSFKKEYIELLKKYEIDYNEKFLFDWINQEERS